MHRAGRAPCAQGCCPPAGFAHAPRVCFKVQEAKITEVKINEARENYRPAAERASLLYFILNDLNKINPIYQFSLKVGAARTPGGGGGRAAGRGRGGDAACGPQAFHVVFEKAIQKTSPADEVRQRVINLTDEITYSVYMYTARGLFERDKLIFLAQVAFQVTPGLASAPRAGGCRDGGGRHRGDEEGPGLDTTRRLY